MENKVYNLEFSWHGINADNFKQKNVGHILQYINAGSMYQYYQFSTYGRIDFADDDTRHLHPIVTEQDKFNRTKTNCLIFDMPVCDSNDGTYDKMFLYYTNGKTMSNYGFVLYNSTTNHMVHKAYIEDTFEDLIKSMSKVMNHLREKMYDLKIFC